jgi:hypothetical protein
MAVFLHNAIVKDDLKIGVLARLLFGVRTLNHRRLADWHSPAADGTGWAAGRVFPPRSCWRGMAAAT